MLLSQIMQSLEEIAPLNLAAEWDNVGLLAGEPGQQIEGVLLTIDLTEEVASEAIQKRCNLVVSYHPPIFQPLKHLDFRSPVGQAVRSGIAIYSPHTALDAAAGGTNDLLADALGLERRVPISTIPAAPTHYKLVTFVPEAAMDSVAAAIFAAGAGRIGKYGECSFRIEGVGTFRGDEGSNPTIGQPGRAERVDEVRLETVVRIEQAHAVINALREAHPYEEPAFDLNVLAAAPSSGFGRVGTMTPTDRAVVFERIRERLGLDHLLIAGPREGVVKRAAVCAGAGGAHVGDAIGAKADLYLTGELRHHDAARCAAAGMTAVCTLHSNSERGVLRVLQQKLTQATAMPPVHISQADRDPFAVIGRTAR